MLPEAVEICYKNIGILKSQEVSFDYKILKEKFIVVYSAPDDEKFLIFPLRWFSLATCSRLRQSEMSKIDNIRIYAIA